MTGGYNFAISRRISPEVCIFMCPLIIRGRREDRVHAAPAGGNTPAFPAQWLYGL